MTQFFTFKSLEDLTALNPRAINTMKYATDLELKRQKQAEILIPDFLPFDKVLDIICFSEDSRALMLATLSDFGITRRISVNLGWYFLPRPSM